MDRSDTSTASSQVDRLSAVSAERLDRLFRLYSDRVLAYAVSRARSVEDGHDIAGETWLQAARSIEKLRADDANAMPWLAGIVRHSVSAQYRPRRADERPTDWSDTLASRKLPAEPSADGDVLALADLTARQATVTKLAAQGLTHRAIASRIGRSHGTVCSALVGAARKLRSAQDDSRPPLPLRPEPHERDGRQPLPEPPVRPHSRTVAALLGGAA